MPGNELNQAVTAAPMMEALLADYPEVEQATRIAKFGGWLVRTEEKRFNETEQDFKFADSSFFQVFDFRLLKGDPLNVLSKPRSIVMTESYAKKYFGDEDPVGKTLRLERDTLLFEVTGVMEDVPVNSHFHFGMLGSLCTYTNRGDDNWLSHNYYTYVVLAPGTDVQKFTDGLRQMVFKYVGPNIEKILGFGIDQFEAAGNSFGYFTQPLKEIHLHSNLQAEIEPNGNITYVYVFLIIAVLILVVACINFMNLATARATTRAREVGLRKVVGSHRSVLIYQFISESVVTSIISLASALILVYLLLPGYNNLIRLKLDFSIFSNTYTLPFLIILALLVGLLAGTYPAFVLASFRPATVLKSDIKSGPGRSLLRSLLVILQFGVTIIILLGTIFVSWQLRYMQKKDPGFGKENVLVIIRSDALKDKIDAFKQELSQHANIVSVANTTHIPSSYYRNNAHWLEGQDLSNTLLLMSSYVSYDFGTAMDLELVAGRFHSRDIPTDSSGVVINEAAVKTLAIKDPLNTRFMGPGRNPGAVEYAPIIGIVKDFHYESMHEDIHPMAIHFMPGNFEGYIIVKLSDGVVQETISFIQKVWDDLSTDYPFEYTWLEDEFNKLFDPERRTSQILTVFSILCMFISCLGLLGLVSYSTSQRTKEIGIRKTNGASVTSILSMLSVETIRLTGMAAILAVPAYFIIKRWLQNFAYHISFNPGIFFITLVLVTLFVLVIALLTVSFQSYKAAARNPAESLRTE
jgi:putative ABC transport system permease protein